MRLLLDTHLLIWAMARPSRFSKPARAMIENAGSQLMFSVVSLWEIAIKSSLGRADFAIEPRLLRQALLDSAYVELQVVAAHAFALVGLPLLHRDPFDRMLIAQATAEGVTLLTVDPKVARYPGPVQKV